MADRVSATIRIGGRLPAAGLPELIAIIEEDALGPEWDASFNDPEELATYLRDGAEGVSFYDDQVANGEFGRLQAFCVHYRLNYVLTYDGYGGQWSPARRIRRPDDEGDGVTCPLTEDQGEACVSSAQIKALGLTTLDEVLQHLERFDLAQVPAFEIVSDPRHHTGAEP